MISLASVQSAPPPSCAAPAAAAVSLRRFLIWKPDTLVVLAHTRTNSVHTEYDHALRWTLYVLGHTCECQYKSVHTSTYWSMSKVKSTYGVCTKCIIQYWDVHCMYFNPVLYIQCMYFVCISFVQCSYSVCTEHVQKWVFTYKLHHFQNSLKAVCTEYILCSSVHSTESVPAAYSKSIKAFIPIITLSVLHPCRLQEGPLAAAGGSAGRASAPAALTALVSTAARPRRPRWPPLQRGRRGRGCSSAARPCCRTEGASEGLPQPSWQSIVQRWICRGQGCDVVMLTLQRR